MYRPSPHNNHDRHYDSPYLGLLWKLVRHVCFALLGLGIALFMTHVLGFQTSTQLFLVTFSPVIAKVVLLVGCFGFILILIESLK